MRCTQCKRVNARPAEQARGALPLRCRCAGGAACRRNRATSRRSLFCGSDRGCGTLHRAAVAPRRRERPRPGPRCCLHALQPPAPRCSPSQSRTFRHACGQRAHGRRSPAARRSRWRRRRGPPGCRWLPGLQRLLPPRPQSTRCDAGRGWVGLLACLPRPARCARLRARRLLAPPFSTTPRRPVGRKKTCCRIP